MQEVRHAASRRAVEGVIEIWRTFRERLARDLYRLWGDRVLRARNPDGKDYGFKLKYYQTLRVTPAMEAGIETRVWSIEEIVGLLDRRAEQAA